MSLKWDPKQYNKFEKERSAPFLDLIALIQPVENPRILDLGCGMGALTTYAHETLHGAYSLGIDNSKEMLEFAKFNQSSRIEFKLQDIESFSTLEKFQIAISNAALQWVPSHQTLFAKIKDILAPGGQIAIQMPFNQAALTHLLAEKLIQEPPFNQGIPKENLFSNVLSMEEYAYLLVQLGFKEQIIRQQLYVHLLESTNEVFEWVKGSLLSYYRTYLSPSLYEQFLKEYQKRLINQLGWSEPYCFLMKRLFIWGRI